MVPPTTAGSMMYTHGAKSAVWLSTRWESAAEVDRRDVGGLVTATTRGEGVVDDHEVVTIGIEEARVEHRRAEGRVVLGVGRETGHVDEERPSMRVALLTALVWRSTDCGRPGRYRPRHPSRCPAGARQLLASAVRAADGVVMSGLVVKLTSWTYCEPAVPSLTTTSNRRRPGMSGAHRQVGEALGLGPGGSADGALVEYTRMVYAE